MVLHLTQDIGLRGTSTGRMPNSWTGDNKGLIGSSQSELTGLSGLGVSFSQSM